MDLRVARVATLGEYFRKWLGYYPLRCRRCQTRFVGRLWDASSVRYAKCPLCLRTDLADWTEPYLYPPAHVRALRYLGGRPYRCESCRYNFVSFRPRQYKYVPRKSAGAKAANGI